MIKNNYQVTIIINDNKISISYTPKQQEFTTCKIIDVVRKSDKILDSELPPVKQYADLGSNLVCTYNASGIKSEIKQSNRSRNTVCKNFVQIEPINRIFLKESVKPSRVKFLKEIPFKKFTRCNNFIPFNKKALLEKTTPQKQYADLGSNLVCTYNASGIKSEIKQSNLSKDTVCENFVLTKALPTRFIKRIKKTKITKKKQKKIFVPRFPTAVYKEFQEYNIPPAENRNKVFESFRFTN